MRLRPCLVAMAQRKGNGGRQPWRHRRWKPNGAQQTGRVSVADGQGREEGFWEGGTRPSRGAGGSGRVVEGVAEAETFRRGGELRWEQLSPSQEDGHSLLADGHSRQTGAPIPASSGAGMKKDSRMDSAYAEFIREFFEDTRTKPRDETWIHPRFRRNLPVPPAEPVDAAVPYNQAEEQAQQSAKGLNPFAKPFVPGQYGSIPPPAPLSPEIRGRPKFGHHQEGVSGRPSYRQKQAVDKSEYKFSPHARNFVPSKDLLVGKGETEQAGKELAESSAATKGEPFKSCTLYILHHAYDVGAEYEDVHQVYARRYGGDEKATEEVAKAILKDAKYLLAEKYGEDDLVAGGIGGSGILRDKRLNERMKRLMNEFVAEARKFPHRLVNQVTLGLREQDNWGVIQQRDIKFSQAEKCTDIEIEIMEIGLATLENTGKYKKNDDKVRGVQGLHLHLKNLRERQAKFRRETKKILDEMTRQRAVMFVRCSSNSGIDTGSAMVYVDEAKEQMASLPKGKAYMKPNQKHNESDLEANVEIAMKGPGALDLGLIDSEDDDDGGVKLSPEEARSWW
ncbi:hypothetical protein TWF506_007689 [Arthrobotrys conoides]|uniref:Uncharacterized protein n=1 Tax=Arthrobotrys conoides TaxID=74498 RepID=A0AAN8NF04_9PEZI